MMAVVVLDMLSASRAFVAAESQWSKAHQSAIFHLDRFAETGDSAHLLQARENLRSPLMDRHGRLALEPQIPDFENVRRQLQIGSTDDADAPQVIRLYPFFKSLPHVNEAIRLWRESDTWVLVLGELLDELATEWRAEQPRLSKIRSIRAELAMIQTTLNQQASEISQAIERGSRSLSRLALLTTVVVLSVLASVSLLLFLWALRGIRSSRNRFWNTFEQAPVGMALIDGNGAVLETNESLIRFLERQRKELIGKPLFHFCESNDRALMRKLITDQAMTGRRLVGVESRFSRADGSQASGRLSIASLDQDNHREGIHVAVIEDVT
ncbi:MAG: PAS domain S-box protein, partial [Xanthomonadaceae bacterium]|nr:PAS domain S-box protein [Xanthomonadaceae bacterium]